MTKYEKNGSKNLLNMLELATLESSFKACLPSVKLKNSPLTIDLFKVAATYGILYPASSCV